ncbi:hypothetical protein NPIL_262741 [Nephila pilipes]|uniref:Uncharacterized protein n=1 Tax=Nephila pilipes TaxID=299642 RepID=A0A8X6P5M6_NEPPI|nr:hypothetical protein NPIL_262741 [Nephila pilipes]
MKSPRTARPFILSQTGWMQSLYHQRCSCVINEMDEKVKERAHALSSQPTMTLVAIAVRTRTIPLFPTVQHHEGETLPRYRGVVSCFERPEIALWIGCNYTPLVRSVGQDAIGEREPIIAATKDRHPVVVEKNLTTGFFQRRGKETSPKIGDMTRGDFEIPRSHLFRSGIMWSGLLRSGIVWPGIERSRSVGVLPSSVRLRLENFFASLERDRLRRGGSVFR